MNQSNSSEVQIEDISHLVYYVIYTPFFLVGIVGNGLLIFIIACHERMRTVPNLFICNLAVASLMSIAVATLYPYLDNDAEVGKPVCALTQLLRRTCITANTMTLTALTVERYCAIAFARNVFVQCGITITKITVCLIWCVSFFLAIVSLSLMEYRCSRTGPYFRSKALEEKASIFSLFFPMVLTPLLSITVLYILMMKELNRDVPSVNNQKRKKFAWVVLALLVVFAVTHLPFYALSLAYYNTTNPYKTTTVVLLSLSNLQACVNPIVLYGFSEPCRSHINHYVTSLLRWCVKRLDSPREISGNACHPNSVTRSDLQDPYSSETSVFREQSSEQKHNEAVETV